MVGVDGDSDRLVYAFNTKRWWNKITRTDWVSPDTVVWILEQTGVASFGQRPPPRTALYRMALDDTAPTVSLGVLDGNRAVQECFDPLHRDTSTDTDEQLPTQRLHHTGFTEDILNHLGLAG